MSAALSMIDSPLPSETKPTTRQDSRILIVDDDREMCEVAAAGLKQKGYSVEWCMSPEEALQKLDTEDFVVLLADIHMEGMSGLDLCRAALGKRPDLMVVVMTGFGTVEHAVGAMRAGAYDFVTKPVSMEALALAMDRALRHRAMSTELKSLRRRVDDQLHNIVGRSEAMRRMADLVSRVADSDTNVLITGESGTGKELVAHALHESSGRTGPFLAINCAAVPETLLESELFGHAKGAFTDARGARDGLFVEANGGTLFLDEIGEMPLGMQAKILRALQERKVRPLGSTREINFDARIITATNRDLDLEVKEKRFREDLYYRVNVVRVEVPALRERNNDILLLTQHFLQQGTKDGKKQLRIGRLVAERLIAYDWPGNVRELQNCIERAVALARFDEITLDDLPQRIREHQLTEVHQISDDPSDLPPMKEVEQRHIRRVLAATGGNKTLAASILGLDRRTLYRKLSAERDGEQDASAMANTADERGY